MNYKGYEIADKMSVTECGVETYIRVEDCDVTAETFREYLENCDNRLVKMENDGFKVKGYHISVSVEEPVYNEDGMCSDYVVNFTQIIEREETSLESEARISEWKKQCDHWAEVYDKLEENHKKRVERILGDKNYAAYWYQMNILKQYGVETISYEKWCEKNKILSK